MAAASRPTLANLSLARVMAAGRPPQPAARPRPGIAGFSLLELVLVLAILTTVAALASPRYAAAQARYRAACAASRVADDLELARSEARKTSSSQTVRFETNTSQIHLPGVRAMDRPQKTWVTELDEPPYEAILVSARLGGDEEISFDGFGMPDSGGEIVIEVAGLRRTVRIDPDTGEVLLP